MSVAKDTAPLVKALVAIDKTDPTTKNPGKERDALHKGLEKEFKNFKAAAAKYGKTIDIALKNTDKGLHKDAYRAMKSMKAHLEHIEASVEHHLVTSSKEQMKAQEKMSDRIDKETKKARDKGLDDKAVNQEVDYSKQIKQLIQFSTQVKTVATNAKAAVQSIKSDPTPATYNAVMDKGGRNYTQQFSNLIKFSKDAKCPPKVKAILNGLDKHKSGLDAYGNGDRRKIALTSTKDDVMKYTKEFVQLLKDTYPYAEEMQAYLKKNKLK